MRDAPRGSKFFQFYAVFGKIWQNGMLAPPEELASPPRGNPGSVTDYKQKFGVNYNIINNNNNLFSLSDYIVHAFAVLFVSVSVPSLT